MRTYGEIGINIKTYKKIKSICAYAIHDGLSRGI